jgi:MGT family glycosyltransferase
VLTRILLPEAGSSSPARASTDRRMRWTRGRVNAALEEFLLATVPEQIDDLTAIVDAFGADVLITDVTLLGPILLREKLRIPIGVFSVLAACSLPGPEAPPWGRGLPPPRTMVSRARSAIERRVIDWMLAGLRKSASDVRRRAGLPPISGRLADQYGRMPLFMVASAPELDYERRDLPTAVQYVGACLWDGGGPQSIALPWLDALPSGTPIVHVTEGTIHTNQPLVLRAAAAGLSNRPMHVVMTTGRHRRPEDLDLGPLGANIRVEQFVPHHALLPRCDVVVTTGGAGTVTTALVAGAPLVVVPTGWDLPENAQRVVECGAGVRVDARRCTPARLRRAVETILANPEYRHNARRVGAALVRQGGAERAANLIEMLAAGQRQSDVETSGRRSA